MRGRGASPEQDGDDVGEGSPGGGGEVQRRVALQVHGVDGGTVFHQQLHNLQKGLARPIIRVNVNKQQTYLELCCLSKIWNCES